MDFRDRLERAWRARDSMLCVGLDPDPMRFPASVGQDRDAVAPFLEAIVAASQADSGIQARVATSMRGSTPPMPMASQCQWHVACASTGSSAAR